MTAPAPLVPAECSMRGNDWFPLYFDRLRKSKWWRRASDMARARNVMLWGEAYKGLPAGSMADDDDELAEAAGFGMDVDAFLAAKPDIMGPWVLCSDGRWYHPTICEVVLEAWERTSDRKKKAAEKKAAQRAKVRGPSPAVADVPQENGEVPATPAIVPGDSAENGRDIRTQYSTGQDKTEPPNPQDGGEQLFELQPDEGDPPDPVQQAFDLWNQTATACCLPKAKALDENRRKAIRKRLEGGGLELWRHAMSAIEVSAFLRGLRPGSDGRIFKADLTFVCQAKSFQRLVDGGYGEDAEPPKPAGPAAVVEDPERRRLREFKTNGFWNRLDWGPAPGKDGCRVSPEIQREFGVEPAKPQAIGRVA